MQSKEQESEWSTESSAGSIQYDYSCFSSSDDSETQRKELKRQRQEYREKKKFRDLVIECAANPNIKVNKSNKKVIGKLKGLSAQKRNKYSQIKAIMAEMPNMCTSRIDEYTRYLQYSAQYSKLLDEFEMFVHRINHEIYGDEYEMAYYSGSGYEFD